MRYEQLMRNLPCFEDISDAMKYTWLQSVMLPEPEFNQEPLAAVEGVAGTRKVMTLARYRRRQLIGVLILIIGMFAACFEPTIQ